MFLIEINRFHCYNGCVGGFLMLTAERHDYILNKLRETGIVRLQELVNELNCSESTIRRD